MAPCRASRLSENVVLTRHSADEPLVRNRASCDRGEATVDRASG